MRCRQAAKARSEPGCQRTSASVNTSQSPPAFSDAWWQAQFLPNQPGGSGALRAAAIAIAMLFLCGYGWGRYAGQKPWRAGLVMVLQGVIVEAIVIALGG